MTQCRLLNVVDVEATCWPGRRPPGQLSEIIEIGLCVVDLTARTRVSRHRLLVRPAHSAVSPFCTSFTGLTPDEVATGADFPDACATLAGEHDSRSRAWASWGDYDRKQFERQCARSSTPYPFSSVHFNAKRIFAETCGLSRTLGMGAALRHAGLPLEGRHHRGEDDAWNIAALVLDIAARGGWPNRPGVEKPQ